MCGSVGVSGCVSWLCGCGHGSGCTCGGCVVWAVVCVVVV